MAEAKNNKRRKFRLRLFLSVVVVVVIAFVFADLRDSWREYQHLPHIPGRVEVFVGIYPNITQGQKASLLRLSEEISRHPKANSFVIRRAENLWPSEDIDWSETIYDRQGQTIDDGNVWAGDTQAWGGVNDRIVKTVVATSDSFRGFSRSGCRDMIP